MIHKSRILNILFTPNTVNIIIPKSKIMLQERGSVFIFSFLFPDLTR